MRKIFVLLAILSMSPVYAMGFKADLRRGELKSVYLITNVNNIGIRGQFEKFKVKGNIDRVSKEVKHLAFDLDLGQIKIERPFNPLVSSVFHMVFDGKRAQIKTLQPFLADQVARPDLHLEIDGTQVNAKVKRGVVALTDDSTLINAQVEIDGREMVPFIPNWFPLMRMDDVEISLLIELPNKL